ncbi:MAG: FAD-dependent oxidoreductase [Bdellovibrionota bacterium]
MAQPTHRPRIVILGTGFGALRLLKGLDTKSYEVIVVSPRNYFLFTPLLASSAVGTIEFRSIVEPIRLARADFQYYQASCTSIDAEQRTIHLDTGPAHKPFDIQYDYLVVAVGAAINTFGIPGVTEHALFLKDIPDARALRSKIIECFDQANAPDLTEEERRNLLDFVIIGGGPTGVEFAAELHDLITQDLKDLYADLMPLVRILLIEASPKLLGTFDETLSEYTARAFSKQNIVVRTKSSVAAVERGLVRLQDGTSIRAGLILWSAGIGPTRLMESLNFAKDRNRLVTNEFLMLPEHPEIYAIGDCAAVAGRSYPATGQLAQSQGKYLAKTFNRRALGQPLYPFQYFNKGMLAYVGSGRALMDVPAVKGKGFFAWLLWRSIYLTKLVSLRNKISVLFDWIRTFCFGRDFSRF